MSPLPSKALRFIAKKWPDRRPRQYVRAFCHHSRGDHQQVLALPRSVDHLLALRGKGLGFTGEIVDDEVGIDEAEIRPEGVTVHNRRMKRSTPPP